MSKAEVNLIQCAACGQWKPPDDIEMRKMGHGFEIQVCVNWRICPWRLNPVRGY